jgi:pimeloyl-ACP methyl ester carboxylesterase
MATAVEPKEGSIEARGLRFHYVAWGESGAPAVVLLHGLSAMCRIWDHFAAEYQDRYRLYALDQRGHGDTSWPVAPAYTTDDFVGDLEALADAWGLRRFALVGLSMGGMNAMAYAARHPEQISHLVPVDIRPAFNRQGNPVLLEQAKRVAEEGHPTFESEDAAFDARKATHPFTPDASIRHHVRHLLRPLAGGRRTFKHDPRVGYHWQPRNLWGELPKVQAPTLIIRGGMSQVLSEQKAAEMRDAFPNGELITIDGAGHTVPEDAPREFNEALGAFLSRHPF